MNVHPAVSHESQHVPLVVDDNADGGNPLDDGRGRIILKPLTAEGHCGFGAGRVAAREDVDTHQGLHRLLQRLLLSHQCRTGRGDAGCLRPGGCKIAMETAIVMQAWSALVAYIPDEVLLRGLIIPYADNPGQPHDKLPVARYRNQILNVLRIPRFKIRFSPWI